MKETKKFFNTNRLNKGYSKSNFNKNAESVYNNLGNDKHILPSPDLLAEYEEMSPGALSKILQMAQKEQDHRHKLSLITLEKNAAILRFRSIFALLISIILGIIVTIGIIMVTAIEPYVGAGALVLSLGIIAYIFSVNIKKNLNDKNSFKKYDNKSRNPNYKGKRNY